MYLDQFAPSWREFHKQQMSRIRVLVADDDVSVGHFLRRALVAEGFTVVAAPTVKEAWEQITSSTFDLVVVDKTMPDESGLALLAKLRDSRLSIPSILITESPSTESIAEALALGAEDCISKPFVSIDHLVGRLRAVLDKPITGLLFNVILGDLSKAVHSGTGTSKEFLELSQSIIRCKCEIGKRPSFEIIDDDSSRATERRQGLCDHSVLGVTNPQVTHSPMVVAVSLESSNSVKKISELRAENPDQEIFAFAKQSDLDQGLAAIREGAADFALLPAEGMISCALRIDRLAHRARRHHLYCDIVGLLYRAACEVRPDLAEDLIFAKAQSGAASAPSST